MAEAVSADLASKRSHLAHRIKVDPCLALDENK
jgi:hypothetical protein